MKLIFRIAILGPLALAAAAQAQYVRVDTRSPGYGTDVYYAAAYDQYTVVRFKAKVKGLSKTPGSKAGEATDVALMVRPFTMGKNAKGKSIYKFSTDLVPVELGPAWFVDDQDTKIKLNDYVEITGSRMVMNGERFIMAQMVRKGRDVLAVRRMSGEPFWYAFRPQPTPAQIANSDMAAAESQASWGPQTEGLHVWNVNSTQVYGAAWPIGGAQQYNVSGFVPNIAGTATTRQAGSGVVIQGYWYNGPPIVVRY